MTTICLQDDGDAAGWPRPDLQPDGPAILSGGLLVLRILNDHQYDDIDDCDDQHASDGFNDHDDNIVGIGRCTNAAGAAKCLRATHAAGKVS